MKYRNDIKFVSVTLPPNAVSKISALAITFRKSIPSETAMIAGLGIKYLLDENCCYKLSKIQSAPISDRKTKMQTINFYLNQETYSKLLLFAEKNIMKKSEALRFLILATFEHVFDENLKMHIVEPLENQNYSSNKSQNTEIMIDTL